MPLNTISMGQTNPTKTNRVWSRLGPRSHSGEGRPPARWSPSSVQPRVSAAQSGSVWFTQGGLGPRPLQAFPGVVGWHITPAPSLNRGGSGVCPPARLACPAGGGVHCPSKGGMPGPCAGEGGCSGGRQRLLVRVAWAKAGRQKARSSPVSLSQVEGGPGSLPLSRSSLRLTRGEGWEAF
jgi:hypothetical protein